MLIGRRFSRLSLASARGSVLWRNAAAFSTGNEPGGTLNKHYEDLYRRSMEDPRGFWEEAAQGLHWDEKWHTTLGEGRPGHPASQWFEGGRLNITTSMLDRHIAAGRGEETALVLDSPLQGGVTVRTSYRQLLASVEALAAALLEMGCGYAANNDAL